MVGCSAGGEGDVATLGSPIVEGSAGPDAAIDALVSCLGAAGLPARLEGAEDLTELGWVEGHDVFATAHGRDWMIRDFSQDYDEADTTADYARFLGEHQPEGAHPYGLEVDGVDYSEVFGECIEASGYAPSSGDTNVRSELVAKQALAGITNDWLTCARENGYPDWADVEAGKADSWVTSPTWFIPLSMSTDELRELLVSCPNFDEETAERLEDTAFNWDADFAAHPAIQVEPPPPPSIGGETDLAAQDDYAHYQELVAVLGEAESEFYARRADDQEPAR
jgi:hypothetical protein